MHVTFDLGDPEDGIDEESMDIWVLVDTLPILPNIRKMVELTYYTDGAELTYQEIDHRISFIIDVENYNINHETPAHYGNTCH